MSIRRYLILVIISSLILVVFSAAIHGYRQSMSAANTLFDNELINIASSLRSFDSKEKIIQVNNNNLAFQIWQSASNQPFANQNQLQQQSHISSAKHQLIYHSNNTPETTISDFKTGFHDANFANNRWRIYVDVSNNRWLMVAQPSNSRVIIAENMILSAMTPLIIVIPFLALFIFIIISRGLAPLIALKSALMVKQSDDLSVIALDNVPNEIIPIIETLNKLLMSLSSSIQRERNFTADVAHELRTPISILRINLHNLLAEHSHSSSIDDFREGVDRLAHVVEQILMLNRINPKVYRKSFVMINLEDLTQQVISELYIKIAEKKQTIALNSKTCLLSADRPALEILLQNLVANAIKYAPVDGEIQVNIFAEKQHIVLEVEDSGPGIPEQQLAKVFDRFYRLPREERSDVIGSGLGLSIVQHIVTLHQGDILLGKSTLGGLKVTVFLPQQQTTTPISYV